MLRPVLLALCASVALGALAGASSPAAAAAPDPVVLGPAGVGAVTAKPAIVAGSQLQIAAVPWQVHVHADGAVEGYECGGSILGPRLVVTAAHCVFDRATGAHFEPSRVVVQAGVSHATTPEPGDVRQTSTVAAIRSHPYYLYDPARRGVAPDDVALLELTSELSLSGSTARAIGLVGGGPLLAPGTAGSISGFGRQAAGQVPDGNLYGVDTTVVDPLACGGTATALLICVQSPTGSACEGDSGGPLTVANLLAGVASFVSLSGPTGPCGINSVNGYTNVVAPEIAEFLRGSAAPPRAPRGGTDISAQGVFQVGGTMTCNPGTWIEAPAFAFTFLDTRDGTPLQQGPQSTYTFLPSDVGRTVACALTAANAGGTGVGRTQASPAIAAAPTPPPAAPVAPTARPRPIVRVSVTSGRATVAPRSTVAFSIRVANRGAVAARGVVVCDAPARGLAFGRRLPRGARRARGAAARICWSVGTLRPRAARTLRVTLRVGAVARRRTLVNAVSVRGSNFSKRVASASVRVR